MVLYNYERYNLERDYDEVLVRTRERSLDYQDRMCGYPNYAVFNYQFIKSGSEFCISLSNNDEPGTVLYYISDSTTLYKRTVLEDNISNEVWYRDETYDLENYSEWKGSLKDTITAENGTYPDDGVDGAYWYVKKDIANTAPSTPEAFVGPTSNEELEIGDFRSFTVWAASDSEGNLSKYKWEVSINGAPYEEIGQTSSPSFAYTIPTATSLRMRVKAVDSEGLESSYRESEIYTVTKPKYYWSKYNVDLYETPVQDGETHILFPIGSTLAYTDVENNFLWDSLNQAYKIKNGEYKQKPYNSGEPGDLIFSSRSGSDQNGIDYYRRIYEVIEWINGGYRAKRHTSEGIEIKGSLIQSGIIAEDEAYPSNGKHTDNYWYVKGSRVNESAAPPAPFTSPPANSTFRGGINEVVPLAWGASSEDNGNQTYYLEYAINEGIENGDFITTSHNVIDTSDDFPLGTSKTMESIQFRIRTSNSGSYSDWIYSDVYTIINNLVPTIMLNTTDNRTLYENDTLTIEGQATDEDVGQVVIVRYQIDGQTERAIETQISNGMPFPFSKSLTLKNGVLYDGETVVTDQLEEGIAHTLKVTVEDDQGGITEDNRTFYVVLNRPPTISIDSFQELADLIDNDTITITGTAGDPEGGNLEVKYNLNGSSYVQIHNGPAGTFSFDLKLEALTEAENIVQIQAIDGYDFVTTKSLIINKSNIETPLLTSFARCQIDAPKGTAKGVLLWIQRDPDLRINAEISMTMTGEPEDFQLMLLEDSVPLTDEITEDTLKFQADAEKENIILKLTLERDSVDVSPSISLISGVLD
ncbi:hypothetical protein ACSVDA_15570 [Cytobacillus sp. Hm23]